MTKPRLADVHCVPIRFQPGDRILVKVKQRLDRTSHEAILKTVRKWAGDHVEVMIVDLSIMDLEILQQSSIGDQKNSLYKQ